MPDERFPRSTPRQREKRRDSRSGLPLIAVQSLSCVVIILIALVMRFAGGEAFQQLRQSFSESLMSNSLMATLSALVDQNTGKGEEPIPPPRRLPGRRPPLRRRSLRIPVRNRLPEKRMAMIPLPPPPLPWVARIWT